MKKTIKVESLDSHFRRLGGSTEDVSSYSFSSVDDLMRALTPGRREILDLVKSKTMAVTEIALALSRDVRAVSRDIDRLEAHEMLTSFYEPNPGHGRRRMVRSEFSGYEYAGIPSALLDRKAWLEKELAEVKRQLKTA